MQVIADLHLHSHFSRAVSPQMTIPIMAKWASKKGIGLMGTGDWTHPLWMKEIEQNLEESGNGILMLSKNIELPVAQAPKFLLSTEISCIFSQNGKTRRVHTVVWVPSMGSAKKISSEITKRGGNVLSDGRPILGFSLIQLSELILSIEPNALIVPAHIWTPWFSVYGEKGGFESLKEAFGVYEKYVYAVETGLSSSPDMNWTVGELDTRSIVSFSDAHSGSKLGREATMFELPELTYAHIKTALQNYKNDTKKPHITQTIEFYPEEGKYHYTGHRDCHIRLTPKEVKAKGTMCSVCGKQLTQGVMQRVSQLATRTYEKTSSTRPPFTMLVPLVEIISEAIGSPVASPKVAIHYDKLIANCQNEFHILMDEDERIIASCSTPQIADGVRKVRSGDIVIDPGYDGVFGVVRIWKSEKDKQLISQTGEQIGIF